MKRANLIAAALLSSICLAAAPARAEDAIESAGVGVGVALGNILFLPVKAISVTMGALSGGLSLALTGNADLSQQIWRDTSQGPYAITPEVSRQICWLKSALPVSARESPPESAPIVTEIALTGRNKMLPRATPTPTPALSIASSARAGAAARQIDDKSAAAMRLARFIDQPRRKNLALAAAAPRLGFQ